MTQRENMFRVIRFEHPDYIPVVFHVPETVFSHYDPHAVEELLESHPNIAGKGCMRWDLVPKDGDRVDEEVTYCVSALRELTLTDEADFADVLRCYTAEHGSPDLGLPLYETGIIRTAHKLCASYSMGTDKYFSLLRFRKVVSAFMKLKASRIPLLDGSLTVQVEGRAGREVFRIKVQNGVPSVTDAEEEPRVILEHKEAELFFFGLLSPVRTEYPIAAAWFPLPIRIEYADQV